MSLPSFKTLAENTTSEIFKSINEKLSDREKQSIINVFRRHVEDELQLRKSTAEKKFSEVYQDRERLLDELISIKREFSDYDKYKAFYLVLNDEPLWGSSRNGEITKSVDFYEGLEEGIKYIKRPTQTIQHLQDPNPKEKVYQHRKDNNQYE